MIRLLLIDISILLLLFNCAGQSKQKISTKRIVIDDESILYGQTDRQQLYFDFPDWKNIQDEYVPSQDIIEQIRNNANRLSVNLFLGTWCKDSKREVPAFFKIMDVAGLNELIDVHMWTLDRSKTLKNGLAKKCNIEFVPTFIFYTPSGKEIGRIIEMPDALFEEDFLKIIIQGKELINNSAH